jgi:microcystin-dependent protein
MPYSVSFTDSTNPAKPSITVADGSLNSQTSMTFVGQGYAGYASVFAGDLLHLLENFAAASAPVNPVQGQLWYDTSTGNNILRVYDGAGNWPEAGSVKRAGKTSLAATNGTPDILNSKIGDLWVDTDSSQLYLFSGSTWLLIGPQFSAGQQTGPLVESIIDTQNASHSVISLYAARNTGQTTASYRIAIISADTFSPKSTIDGYPTIKAGVNLYGSYATGSGGFTSTVWGTTDKALNVVNASNEVISGSNLLRSDTASTTNFPFNIRNQGGLALGADLSLNISQGTGSFLFNSKSSSNSIDFVLNNSYLLHIDPAGKVGIGPNNINPSTALSVAGVITSGTANYPGGLSINNGATVPSTVFNLNSSSGVTSSLPFTVTNTVTLNSIQIGSNATSGPVILPPATTTSAEYDIGSLTQPFRNVYANSFVGSFTGNFNGIVTGSVSGTADSLTTPVTFLVAGDIESSDNGTIFTGQSPTGRAVLNTKISTAFITNTTVAVTTTPNDQFIVYQGSGTGGSLLNMTKQLFLKLDPILQTSSYGTPVGAIISWAGDVSVSTIPDGWLLCDGAEISTGTYQRLFKTIGYLYGAKTSLRGTNTFALPDMRGRFPLARDDMNNLTDITNFVQAKDASGANISTGGQLGTAGRVSDISAKLTGSFSGNQYVVMTKNQLPQHSHIVVDPGHSHEDPYADGGVPFPQVPNTYGYSGSSATDNNQSRYYTGAAQTGITVGNVDATSVGQAINVMNPYLTLNFIIFTGNI